MWLILKHFTDLSEMKYLLKWNLLTLSFVLINGNNKLNFIRLIVLFVKTITILYIWHTFLPF